VSVRKRRWKTAAGVEREAWLVDYRDQSGKRRGKAFAKKKDADAWASRTHVAVAEGTHVPDRASVTVAKAGKAWLASAAADGLEASTVAQYRQHVDLHIVPFIGAEKLSRLNVPLIRAFRDSLLAGDETLPDEDLRRKPRSATMARYVVRSLGTLLADAMERGWIAHNPVADMRRARKARRKGDGKDKRGKALKIGEDIPTAAEMKSILAAATGRIRPFLWTAALTGLRSSELRGLPWKDVDFTKRRISVHQRADRYGQIGSPKTAASQRVVEIPEPLLAELRRWKMASDHSAPDQLVFSTSTGKVENHANIVTRELIPTMIAAGVTKPALDEAGIPKRDEEGKPIVTAKYAGLHAFRHFYASWCAANGLRMQDVQHRMGHSNIAVTMDIYTHLFEDDDTAGKRLNDAASALLG
jgi:integrase